MGTPAYMAPEQLKREAVGPPADLFALGLVLYEMAAGRLPMPGVSLGSALASGLASDLATRVPPLPNVSRGLNTLIMQLLEAAPERRPATAAEVRDRLERLAQDLRSNPARRRAPWVAGWLLLAALAGAGLWRTVAPKVDTGARLVPARITKPVTLPGDKKDPAFSPDGRSVAFSWTGEQGDHYDIYVTRGGGQTPIRLTQGPGSDISPAWSRDGSQIAFLRLRSVSKASLLVVPSEGGPERLVREIALSENFHRAMRPLLTWAPDGTGIVYTASDPESGRASLYVTDLQGGGARKLFDSGGEGIWGNTSPAFSADGKWLAYSEVYGPLQAGLYVRPVSAGMESFGEPIRVPGTNDSPTGSPVWAPDGKRLLFRQGGSIFQWTAGGASEHVYVSSAGLEAMSATWGTAGEPRLVAAENPYKELRAVLLKPGGLAAAGDSVPFAPSATNESSPKFSPDGKWLLFLGSRSGAAEIWVADTNGRNPRQVTHLNTTVIGYPHWSPDSRHIAFHSWIAGKPQIYTIDLGRSPSAAGGGQADDGVKKITDSAFGFFMHTWSGDGKYVYVNGATAAGGVFRVPVDGGLPEPQNFDAGPSVVTPDGHSLVYGKINRPGLFRRSLDGGPENNPEEKLVDDYMAPGNDLNAFADGVYYISWNGESKPRAIRFYSYAQKQSVDILSLSGVIPTPADLAVTPDRRRLVYKLLSGLGTELTLIEFQR